jgi:8-oxo-dGTP diphosphatase
MIFKERSQNFNPSFNIVSCFAEHDGEILVLHRQDHKPEGNTWGIPAGKVDDDEEIADAMAREIQEEAGYKLSSSQLTYFGKVFVKYPEYDFVYHIFHAELDQRHKVAINQNEHKDYQWISPENALNMPLILDLDKCIKLFYGF